MDSFAKSPSSLVRAQSDGGGTGGRVEVGDDYCVVTTVGLADRVYRSVYRSGLACRVYRSVK